MRQYRSIQIVCWFIVAVVFLGLAIWFFMGLGTKSGFHYGGIQILHGPYEEVGRYQVDITDIDSLDVAWEAGGIKITPYDGRDIELVEYAQRDLDEDEKVVYNVQNSTLIIQYCEDSTLFIDFIPSKKLEVFLPESLASNLKSVSLNVVSSYSIVQNLTTNSFEHVCVSGDAELTSILTQEMLLRSTSGRYTLSDITASQANVKTVSGDVKSDNMITDDLTINTTSGNIIMDTMDTKKLYFKSVSGDFSISGNMRELSGDTTSGKLNITDEIIPEGFRIKTVSGDIYLTMPEFDDFNLSHKTVSGDFESEIPVRTKDTEDGQYMIKTTTGDVTIDALY